MKKLPPVLMILVFFVCQMFAQTKPKPKPKPKTTTPAKTTTPTPTPTPVSTPKVAPAIPDYNIILDGLEADVMTEINTLRANPAGYAKYLEDYLKTYNGKYFKNDEGVEIINKEGKVPVEEAIATLKQISSLPAYKLSNGLVKAARDHTLDLVTNNISGHIGSNGSMPDARVAKYGYASLVSENISYYTKTARRVVIAMLIDDGTSSRNHRKNLLSKELTQIGISVGENKAAGEFCVMVFVDKLDESKRGRKSY